MLIAISGPSCSGKTTLARALYRLLQINRKEGRVTLLHQDDFYLPEADIPMIQCTRDGSTNEYVNWDCPKALDMAGFKRVIQSFDKHNGFPEDVQDELAKRSKEHRNEGSAKDVSDVLIQDSASKIVTDEHILIVDGFMLFYDDTVTKLFGNAFLIRGTHDVLKERREARSGYATLEGTWQDPPGFFDQVVWAEYVRTHKHLFKDGNVEGPLIDGRLKSPKQNADLDTSFTFITNELVSCT